MENNVFKASMTSFFLELHVPLQIHPTIFSFFFLPCFQSNIRTSFFLSNVYIDKIKKKKQIKELNFSGFL